LASITIRKAAAQVKWRACYSEPGPWSFPACSSGASASFRGRVRRPWQRLAMIRSKRSLHV